MARLGLHFLGPFQATLDGEELAGLPTTKVRALLAYLAVEAGRPHTRTLLAGLLWPEWQESAARRNLRQALSPLRASLGDRASGRPFIKASRDLLQMDPRSDWWLDVAVFQAQLAQGGEGEAGVAQLTEAISLYRGPFLEGFSVGDSPEFEDWLILWRERLHRQAVVALLALAEILEQQGEHARAVEHARRLLELDPFDEQGHRQLMRSLAMGGQRSAALLQFEACASLLSEEFGVDPSPETAELGQRIRHGEIGGTATADDRPSGLPVPLFHLVGREEELAQIVELVRSPSCRLLTLVGPGGIGKTRLAIEAAGRLAGEFRDGVCFVSLAGVQAQKGVVPAIAQALGLSFEGERTSQEQLFGYLRGRQLLLVLDNLEHLRECRAMVAETLKAAPGVKVLATSRVRLGLLAETLFQVPGMRCPAGPFTILPPVGRDGEETIGEGYFAIDLFLESARRARPGYRVTPDEMQAAIEICQYVDGVPLAILLAAAWLRALSAAEIAADLSSEAIDLFEVDWFDVPARQRSMRAVFQRSWNLLAEPDRNALSALSVFRGGFSRDAAQEVAGASLRDLMVLADSSLVERMPDGRYEMHELLRVFAEERLGEKNAVAAAVRDRHASYYAQAMEIWERAFWRAEQQHALREAGVEMANVQAAWSWATARARTDWLDHAANGLGRFFELQGRYAEGEALFRRTAGELEASSKPKEDGTCLRIVAKMVAWQGAFATVLGRSREARRLLQRSLDLLRQAGSAGQDTRRETAFALTRLGWATYRTDRARDQRLQERSVALYRELGDQGELAAALGGLAWSLFDTGDHPKARAGAEESLAIRRQLGDRRGIAESLSAMCAVAASEGRLDDALQMKLESVAICRDAGHRPALADGLATLGDILRDMGRFSEALDVGTEGLAIQVELGRSERLPKQSAVLGFTKLHLGCYLEARAHAESSLSLAREHDNRTAISYCCDLLGCVALAEGAFSDASRWCQESVRRWTEFESWDGTARALAHLAFAAHAQGQLEQSRKNAIDALRMVPSGTRAAPLLLCVSMLGLLLADQGRLERAIEFYALASAHPLVANSRWFDDVCGKHIEAVAQALPPELVAEAERRGRSRDLWSTAQELLAELT